MDAAEVWTGGLSGSIALLVSVYLVLLFRASRNEQVVGIAIIAMHASLAYEPPPQRALLGAVTDTLVAQERAAARIEAAVHELALHGRQVPQPEELLQELLGLPEPQQLLADFLAEYGGSRGSETPFASIAADLLGTATARVFGNLADVSLAELDRLLLLAAEGGIAAVALSCLGLLVDPGPWPYRAPRLADLDSSMVAIARALDRTTRRHLRLATLLHGQAEAILGIWRDEQSEQRGLVRLWVRARRRVRLPQVRKPAFQLGDLAALEIALDAVGEIVDTAAERLAEGEPARAADLLARLRVPVPAGLPGRMYHQESLAQVRPLAAVGVWHRLAVTCWTASALRAVAQDDVTLPMPAGSSPGAPGRDSCDEGR